MHPALTPGCIGIIISVISQQTADHLSMICCLLFWVQLS